MANTKTETNKTRPLLIIFLVFISLVVFVFLKQKPVSINWLDYQTGMKMAQEQNKPVLLAFTKVGHRFCIMINNDTYKNPLIKQLVEQNFIPILIDIDKQPQLAKQYNVGYYPTHYAVNLQTGKMAGPLGGYTVPSIFEEKLKSFLEELNK
jgi:hypothetical protein